MKALDTHTFIDCWKSLSVSLLIPISRDMFFEA
jgi:hypothetical protein